MTNRQQIDKASCCPAVQAARGRQAAGIHADRREQAGQRRLRGQRQLPGGVAVQIDEQLPVRELRPEQVRDVNG